MIKHIFLKNFFHYFSLIKNINWIIFSILITLVLLGANTLLKPKTVKRALRRAKL